MPSSGSSRKRLTWDEYFVKMLESVAERATCDRGRSAAIVTIDRTIISTGYVGSPPGEPHCDDFGHLMENGHCVRTVHAEQNALASAARRGAALDGATWYTTMMPCRTCAMLMINTGARRVVAAHMYANPLGFHAFNRAHVEVLLLDLTTPYKP